MKKLAAAALVLGLLVMGAGWAVGWRLLATNATPLPLPPEGFVHEKLEKVLQQAVRGESVDYQALLAQRQPLARYVATLQTSGPKSDPARFETRGSRLAYYLNAYNALVLHAVVENWPMTSVQEVRGLVEPADGFGFFMAQRFALDSQQVSLYELENELIREQFGDARIHAAINCASRSCPALLPTVFEEIGLEAQLEGAMAGFVNRSRHVRVDHEAKRVELSAIFQWYQSDFEAEADGLLGYLKRYAGPPLLAELQQAQQAGYGLHFVDYDWALNSTD